MLDTLPDTSMLVSSDVASALVSGSRDAINEDLEAATGVANDRDSVCAISRTVAALETKLAEIEKRYEKIERSLRCSGIPLESIIAQSERHGEYHNERPSDPSGESNLLPGPIDAGSALNRITKWLKDGGNPTLTAPAIVAEAGFFPQQQWTSSPFVGRGAAPLTQRRQNANPTTTTTIARESAITQSTAICQADSSSSLVREGCDHKTVYGQNNSNKTEQLIRGDHRHDVFASIVNSAGSQQPKVVRRGCLANPDESLIFSCGTCYATFTTRKGLNLHRRRWCPVIHILTRSHETFARSPLEPSATKHDAPPLNGLSRSDAQRVLQDRNVARHSARMGQGNSEPCPTVEACPTVATHDSSLAGTSDGLQNAQKEPSDQTVLLKASDELENGHEEPANGTMQAIVIEDQLSVGNCSNNSGDDADHVEDQQSKDWKDRQQPPKKKKRLAEDFVQESSSASPSPRRPPRHVGGVSDINSILEPVIFSRRDSPRASSCIMNACNDCGAHFGTKQGLHLHCFRWCPGKKQDSNDNNGKPEKLETPNQPLGRAANTSKSCANCGAEFTTKQGLHLHCFRWCPRKQKQDDSNQGQNDDEGGTLQPVSSDAEMKITNSWQTAGNGSGSIGQSTMANSICADCGAEFTTRQGLCLHRFRWCPDKKRDGHHNKNHHLSMETTNDPAAFDQKQSTTAAAQDAASTNGPIEDGGGSPIIDLAGDSREIKLSSTGIESHVHSDEVKNGNALFSYAFPDGRKGRSPSLESGTSRENENMVDEVLPMSSDDLVAPATKPCIGDTGAALSNGGDNDFSFAEEPKPTSSSANEVPPTSTDDGTADASSAVDSSFRSSLETGISISRSNLDESAGEAVDKNPVSTNLFCCDDCGVAFIKSRGLLLHKRRWCGNPGEKSSPRASSRDRLPSLEEPDHGHRREARVQIE